MRAPSASLLARLPWSASVSLAVVCVSTVRAVPVLPADILAHPLAPTLTAPHETVNVAAWNGVAPDFTLARKLQAAEHGHDDHHIETLSALANLCTHHANYLYTAACRHPDKSAARGAHSLSRDYLELSRDYSSAHAIRVEAARRLGGAGADATTGVGRAWWKVRGGVAHAGTLWTAARHGAVDARAEGWHDAHADQLPWPLLPPSVASAASRQAQQQQQQQQQQEY